MFHQQQGFTDLHSARITFDSTPDEWYAGTDEPPAGQYAVADSATHELGHATGTYWGGNPTEGNYGGHWIDAPSAMCAVNGAESDWTMCGYQAPGHTYLVPLETHDIDTFQDFY